MDIQTEITEKKTKNSDQEQCSSTNILLSVVKEIFFESSSEPIRKTLEKDYFSLLVAYLTKITSLSSSSSSVRADITQDDKTSGTNRNNIKQASIDTSSESTEEDEMIVIMKTVSHSKIIEMLVLNLVEMEDVLNLKNCIHLLKDYPCYIPNPDAKTRLFTFNTVKLLLLVLLENLKTKGIMKIITDDDLPLYSAPEDRQDSESMVVQLILDIMKIRVIGHPSDNNDTQIIKDEDEECFKLFEFILMDILYETFLQTCLENRRDSSQADLHGWVLNLTTFIQEQKLHNSYIILFAKFLIKLSDTLPEFFIPCKTLEFFQIWPSDLKFSAEVSNLRTNEDVAAGKILIELAQSVYQTSLMLDDELTKKNIFSTLCNWIASKDNRDEVTTSTKLYLTPPFDPSSLIDILLLHNNFQGNETISTNASIYMKRSLTKLPLHSLISIFQNILQSTTDWFVFENTVRKILKWLQSIVFYLGTNDPSDEFKNLASFFCDTINQGTFGKQVTNIPDGYKRSDIFALGFPCLSALMAYDGYFTKQKQNEAITCFGQGLHRYGPSVGRICLNILHLALYQFPSSMTGNLPALVMKLSQITSRTMTQPILEFLSSLSKLPELFVNFTDDDHKRVLGIALQFMNFYAATVASNASNSSNSLMVPPSPTNITPSSPTALFPTSLSTAPEETTYTMVNIITQQYLFHLSHQLLINWFTNLKDQKKFVSFILHFMSLAVKDASAVNLPAVQDNFLLVADMIHHQVESETMTLRPIPTSFMASHASSLNKNNGSDWFLYGNLIMSMDDPKRQIMFRRPLGNYLSSSEIPWSCMDFFSVMQRLKDPFYQNMMRLPHPSSSDVIKRAIHVLDRIPPKDVYKVGVVYVGPGQTKETEILNNTQGSLAYHRMIGSLGTRIRLKGCKDVFTGGLDTEHDLDGTHAVYWQDERSQLVFHITSFMQNHPHDLFFTNKKRHIGNDFVTVVFLDRDDIYNAQNNKEIKNDSFAFETIASQFNYVQIIVRPFIHRSQMSSSFSTPTHSTTPSVSPLPSSNSPILQQTFYKCWIQCKQGVLAHGPLEEPQIVPASSLASMLRKLAIHAHLFSQIMSQNGHFQSNTKERLEQIRRIGQRYGQALQFPRQPKSAEDAFTQLNGEVQMVSPGGSSDTVQI